MNDIVVIVDYKMGNLHTIHKKINRLGYQSVISSDPDVILNADKLFLPGVGHFSSAMHNLKEMNLISALNKAVLDNKTPVLGICLGMQLMATRGEEGDVDGLSWFDAKVVKFNQKEPLKHKVPQVGWNTVSIDKESALMKGIGTEDEFYFVHSFHIELNNPSDSLNSTEYGYNFVSGIQKDNIYGVQYHPEKSHDIGTKLFKNFLEL